MSGLDALGESDDVFDDDDPFAYSKSRMGKDKSSFLSYSKDASSSSAAGNMSGLSLKDRAKLMLEASKNSSNSKASAKSAKKGRKTKTVKQATANAKAKAALTATGSTGGSDSLRRSGGFSAGAGSGGANTPDKSLSRTGVDDRWSSRFDDLDDLSIDEKDWETPEQRAEREAREAQEALEIEASSIAQDDGSMHRLSHAGFGGAVDEPSSESEEEEVIDPLSMTVSQIKEVNARNQEIRQRKFQKQRQKEEAEREEKRARLNAAREALQAGVDECEEMVKEDEDNGDLSNTLTAKGMEEALEKLRKAMSEAEAAGIHDTPDGLLVDHGEDVVEQVEELLATQIMREGDAAKLRDIIATAQKSGDHASLARGIENAKAAGHLSSGHPVFAEAEAVALELAEQSRLRKEKAEQDAKAVALQEALQNAYDKANNEKLFSDEQRAAIPALKDALQTALESQLFRGDDYLVEDARDLIERVDERFARQRAKEAYAALKAAYTQQDDAYAEGHGNYELLKAAIDEAIITGSDEKDPLIQMAHALLGDMKEEYDQMMAQKAAEEAAERERLSKAVEVLREAVAKARAVASAANGLEGVDRLKIAVQASDIAALTAAVSATTGCTGEEDLLAEAAELEGTLKERLASREEAEAAEAAEKKRKDEEKAAKKAAKAKKKAEWKAKVAEATDRATATRDYGPLEKLLEEAEQEKVLQQRYEDDTFVSATMQTAVDLVKQLKEEKIAAEAAAEAAAAAAAAEAEREAAAAANQDALDLNEALNTTPPVPDFQSSFAQAQQHGVSPAASPVTALGAQSSVPSQAGTPRFVPASNPLSPGAQAQSQTTSPAPLLVSSNSPRASQSFSSPQAAAASPQNVLTADPNAASLDRVSGISIGGSNGALRSHLQSAQQGPSGARVPMGPPPLMRRSHDNQFGYQSLGSSGAAYPLQVDQSFQMQPGPYSYHEDSMAAAGGGGAALIDASQLAASMSINYDTDSEADEAAKKTFWRVMRGSQKVLRKSLGKRRQTEAKAMALALSAKDKIIADLSGKVEKMQLDAAKAEADAAMREEGFREELELAAAETLALREQVENTTKAAESPAELALQQMRQEVADLLQMRNDQQQSQQSGTGGEQNSEDDEAFENQPEVQPRIVALAKEFTVVERLMRGYEKENAKLAAALKQQKHNAARAHSELRNENARLSQQNEVLKGRLRRAIVANAGNVALSFDGGEPETEGDLSTKHAEILATESQGASHHHGSETVGQGEAGAGPRGGAGDAGSKVLATNVLEGDVSYSNLRQSLSREQEFRDIQNTLLEERQRHTDVVMALRGRLEGTEQERNQLEGLVRNLRAHIYHLEETCRAEHLRAASLDQQIRDHALRSDPRTRGLHTAADLSANTGTSSAALQQQQQEQQHLSEIRSLREQLHQLQAAKDSSEQQQARSGTAAPGLVGTVNHSDRDDSLSLQGLQAVNAELRSQLAHAQDELRRQSDAKAKEVRVLKQEQAKMAARYERQLLRAQASTAGVGGVGTNHSRSGRHRRGDPAGEKHDAEVASLKKRVRELQTALEASQSAWTEKNQQLQAALLDQTRGDESLSNKATVAALGDAPTPSRRRGAVASSTTGDDAAAARGGDKTPFLRKGEGLRADMARANNMTPPFSRTTSRANRGGGGIISENRSGTPSQSVARRRPVTTGSRSRRLNSRSDAVASEIAAEALAEKEEQLARLTEQLHESEEIRAELQRALRADAEAQRKEIETVKREIKEANKERLSRQAERHEQALQEQEVKHARDLGVALQEKARAESELAKARAALADARAEADALIHQKQHPKARAFHKLEQRVADMEDRYRAREAELQAVIAQSSEAREAEREMQARKFAAQMEKKDEQVRLFRLELDSILDVIRALRSGASLQNTAGIIRSDSLSERLDEFAQRHSLRDEVDADKTLRKPRQGQGIGLRQKPSISNNTPVGSRLRMSSILSPITPTTVTESVARPSRAHGERTAGQRWQ